MSDIKAKNRLETIDVLMLSDDQALQWLRDHSSSIESRFISDEDAALHRVASFVFARRSSKRLRLAVAQHGSHVYTLRKLLKKGTKTERLGVLSNPYIGPHDKNLLWGDQRVLSEAEALDILSRHQTHSREFAVFVSNPHLNRDWLADTISSWAKEEKYNESFVFLTLHLADNKIISDRRDESFDESFLDGFVEAKFNQLNVALFNLLQSAPVTRDWACVLSRIIERLYLPYIPSLQLDLIERWKDPEPTEEGDGYWFMSLRSNIVQYVFNRWDLSFAEDKYSIAHDDPAVRIGLYRSLSPEKLFQGLLYRLNYQYPSFKNLNRDSLSEPECKLVDICQSCFERDKNEFVWNLIHNAAFWTRWEHRDFLKNIAWHLAEDPNHGMTLPNAYNGNEAYYRREHPEFFSDELEEETLPEDLSHQVNVDDSLSRIHKSLDELHDGITALSKKSVDRMQFRRLKSLVKDSNEKLQKLSNQASDDSAHLSNKIERCFKEIETIVERKTAPLVWALIIIALVIGYLQMFK